MKGLPIGWSQCEIGDVAKIVGGATPPSTDPKNFSALDGFPWITPADLSGYSEMYVSRGARNLTNDGLDACSARPLPAGSVLFSSRAPIGYVAIAANPVTTNQGFKSLVLPSDIDPRYVYFYLKHIRPIAEARATGTTFKELSGASMAKLPLLVAPLAEQKRIADKLDALITRVNTCRERLERVPDILKRFRQSVLAAATSGDLTRDWRELNSQRVDAAALARTLQDTHLEAGGHKVGNAAPPTEGVHNLAAEMFPSGWSLLTLRDLVRPDRPVTYGILKPGPELNEGVPYVRVADFPGDRINLASIRKTSPAIDAEFKRSKLLAGDVLLSIRGTVGRIVMTPPQLEGANITQDTARLSMQSSVNATYVMWALRSELVQRRMRGAVKGVAVRGINIGDVRALQVPLPSRAEQDEIVARVETLMTYSDHLADKVRASIRYAERLAPSVLAKAFRGQLVPQDLDDEPASELLSRLRDQRPAMINSKRKRQRNIGTKPPMKSADKEVVKAIILKLKHDSFSFDELRESVSGDYDSIKDVLFELLQEPDPVVRQVFDKKAKAMKIVRVKA